jgi:hypothetical protein
LTGRNIRVNGVRFRTKNAGTISITGVEKAGTIESKADGGEIVLQPAKGNE